MALSRYHKWDGTQEPFGRDADELFDRLAEDLFQGADFDYALQRLLSRGWRDARGKRLPGFDEMIDRLRQRRQQQLKRYNLDDVFGNIRERLNDILRRERQGIQDRLNQAPDSARRVLEKIAKKKQEELDRLPEDVGGAIRNLNDYEFMDEGAAQAFQKLMEELKQQISQTYFRNMTQTMQQLRPQDLGQVKAMLKELNQMLRDRLEGRTPDFAGFMRRFGHFFGPNPPKTLDELVQHLERQMAQMESLLQSLSPEQRAEMEQLIASTLSDPELQAEMAELAAALELLSPRPQLGNRYAFYGSESLPMQEALSLMERLQGIEDLEQALREGYQGRQLTAEQSLQLQELLGPDARQAADQISELGAQRLRAARTSRHGAHRAWDAPHRSEGAARPLLTAQTRSLRRSSDQRPGPRLGALRGYQGF
jgi:uncharacterized protein with von Willebrand factor type A (vWA) domain